jgi:uncharacterized protein YraI
MKRYLPALTAGLLAVFSHAAMAYPALVVGDHPMRLGPGLRYPIVLTIADGSTVNTRACRGVWCEVRVGGRRGFVNVRRLDFAAYAPRKPERAESRRMAGRKHTRPERTSSVSRGARELAPRRGAEPPQPPVRRMPAAEMPRWPLPPPPVIEAPPTVPSITPKPLPSTPSQAPEKPPFKPPEGAPEISL